MATKQDYVELSHAYAKALNDDSTAEITVSVAEQRLLGKELTLTERLDLIATNSAFVTVAGELMKNSRLSYQAPDEVDLEAHAKASTFSMYAYNPDQAMTAKRRQELLNAGHFRTEGGKR